MMGIYPSDNGLSDKKWWKLPAIFIANHYTPL